RGEPPLIHGVSVQRIRAAGPLGAAGPRAQHPRRSQRTQYGAGLRAGFFICGSLRTARAQAASGACASPLSARAFVPYLGPAAGGASAVSPPSAVSTPSAVSAPPAVSAPSAVSAPPAWPTVSSSSKTAASPKSAPTPS